MHLALIDDDGDVINKYNICDFNSYNNDYYNLDNEDQLLDLAYDIKGDYKDYYNYSTA